MAQEDRSNAHTGAASEGKPLKKPYQKPAFYHERMFETMALACGKISPSQQQCRTSTKNS